MYELWQDFRVKSKFWGKSIEFTPYGNCYLRLTRTGEIFTWKKVTSVIHNVIGGTPWAEHYGELKITNHLTAESCVLVFRKERGIFSQSSDNEVTGHVRNAAGRDSYAVKGAWSERLLVFGPPVSMLAMHGGSTSLVSLNTAAGERVANSPSLKAFNQLVWQHRNMPDGHRSSYGFNEFAMSLNEVLPALRPLLPPTDTRLRPDQRHYEHGRVDLADSEKGRLEELQRERRKTMDTVDNPWKPVWFQKVIDPYTNEESWQFTGSYWECRRAHAFDRINFSLW
jgi:hypothetical protein